MVHNTAVFIAPQAAPVGTDVIGDMGVRLRAWRARRGMTRKQLARDSGLSERFLADLESGRGNVSIHSLQAAAGALNISVMELLQDAPPPELARLHALLAAFSGRQLAQAHALLARTFGLQPSPGRQRRVALIGLRGAGKSTLGQQLAQARGLPFVELDREVEREAGTSMNEILLLHGQAGYRRYERRALLRVAGIDEAGEPDEATASPGVVITTGGSLVSESETFDLLQTHFHCVWIKASPEEHMGRVVAQGDVRPMRGNTEAMDDLRRILASREPLYARADAVVDTSGRSVKQSLKDLLHAVPDAAVATVKAAKGGRKTKESAT